MQQITVFVRILPSLYRLETQAVYAYLPENGEKADAQLEAEDIYHRGGTFIYLRRTIEEHKELLVDFVEKLRTRPAILFLDNDGNYARHWIMWSLYLKDGRIRQTGIVFLYGFRILIADGSEVEADQEGIRFVDVSFGRRGTEPCKEVTFSWDGRFRFLIHAGESFLQEAQIRYELDGYDSLTQRYLSVICRTGMPQWDTKEQSDNIPWAQADIFWDIDKETGFTFPENTLLSITGFPEVKMESLTFRFAAGTEDHYLAPYGRGIFLEDADVKMGEKGICRIRQCDRMQMSVVPEGYLGEQGLCAEVSMLKFGPSLFAAGIELEMATSVPVLPLEGDEGRPAVEQFLNRKLREGTRLAYSKDVCLGGDKFEICIAGREVLWFNLHGQEINVPGIALCHVDRELVQAIIADSFFVVLDGQDKDLFEVPYTIDDTHLTCAMQAGYSEEECSRLLRCYPKGRIFLSESTFRQAIENADCNYEETIKQACHHFQVSAGEHHFSFLPEDWPAEKTIFLIKTGMVFCVADLADDTDMWSFRPGQTQDAQQLIKEIGDKAQGTAWEDAFLRPEWEGSIVIKGREEPSGQIRLLILQAGKNTVIFGTI